MSAETALALLIVAMYLLDSLHLLRADEVSLVGPAHGRGPWRARFGARNFKLAGREPHLAHPLLPHHVGYKLVWRMDHGRWSGGAATAGAGPLAGDGPGAADVRDARDALPAAAAGALSAATPMRFEPLAQLRRLNASTWVSWALVLFILPLTLLGGWGMLPTLAAALLLYFNIALALGLTYRWRAQLGLSGRAFALLAFECLSCAPYAANLLRRIAWQQPVAEDFFDAAARLLPAHELAQVQRECLARIEEQLEAEPENSALAQRLRVAHAGLAAHVARAACATPSSEGPG